MSALLKAVAVLGVTATLAACGSNNEPVVVEPAPITVDPVSTKF